MDDKRNNNIKCPICGKNGKVYGHGTVMTKSKGRRKRYICGDCGSTFYKDTEGEQ